MTIDELAALIKGEFDEMGRRFDKVEKEIELRPTKSEIFSWADERIASLELKADQHDYLHINELDNLPPQAEISRALLEKGLKPKLA